MHRKQVLQIFTQSIKDLEACPSGVHVSVGSLITSQRRILYGMFDSIAPPCNVTVSFDAKLGTLYSVGLWRISLT